VIVYITDLHHLFNWVTYSSVGFITNSQLILKTDNRLFVQTKFY